MIVESCLSELAHEDSLTKHTANIRRALDAEIKKTCKRVVMEYIIDVLNTEDDTEIAVELFRKDWMKDAK
jgi:molecular chaperone GrpE (heat shock protein)